jgi:hypothetical protein
MCSAGDGNPEIVGFILYSGVFPHARIQQIAVAEQHRRGGIASALINEIVSQLEGRAYLTVTAAVASDLIAAQEFYEKNRFVARRSVPGGQARKRTIIVRTRDLETESLFSVLELPSTSFPSVVDLGLRKRSAGYAPLYAIDLNVMFDVIKGKRRQRSQLAERLIAAALAHQIRLAVAPEFVVELERTTQGEDIDPVLRLARQLPRLTSNDLAETGRLATLVHTLVFVTPNSPQAETRQALSDARHIAEAALAGASGYVTSDGQLLAARERLFHTIGIDVVSLHEFETLLPSEPSSAERSWLKGTECVLAPVAVEAVRRYLEEHSVARSLISEFVPNLDVIGRWRARAVSEGSELVAIGARIAPANIDGPMRLLVHVRPDHVACEVFADHLLASQCHDACDLGPVTIELPHIPGQSAVRRAATLMGFVPVPRADISVKVALGRPVTHESWTTIARQTRRRTGLRLPEQPPDDAAVRSGLLVQGPDGREVAVRLSALEDALSPTILLWPGRGGVIVPIARNYADDLLGTGNQFPLFGSPEAAFVTRRTYFNSPRTATLMRPGVPMLFYESKRSGGRGAIVAVARVVDATVVGKLHVPDDLLRRAVVEDLGPLSASADLLATTFDSLIRFPAAVSLEMLRRLGIETASNFQTTTAVPHSGLAAILELGWSRA